LVDGVAGQTEDDDQADDLQEPDAEKGGAERRSSVRRNLHFDSFLGEEVAMF
jgi:hypothetical protein